MGCPVKPGVIPSGTDPWPPVWEDEGSAGVVLRGIRERERHQDDWILFLGPRRGFEDLVRNQKPLLSLLFFPSSSTGPCSCPFSLYFFSVRFQPIISRKTSVTEPEQPRTNGLNPPPYTHPSTRQASRLQKSDRFTCRTSSWTSFSPAVQP